MKIFIQLIPKWEQGKTADQLAQKLLTYLHYKAYKELDYNEWFFKPWTKAKFNNDPFLVVAPYKLFDKGVESRLVKQNNKLDALFITYLSGGEQPLEIHIYGY